jgi:hypothetical protein
MAGTHKSVFDELKQVDALIDLHREPQLVEERLPFTVRIVQNEEDLLKAVRVRYEAYARHMPSSASAMSDPEADDVCPGSALLVAESKLDGGAIGSVRVQTNQFGPLPIERSIKLPTPFASLVLADARRLSIVRGGEGGLVRMAMFKALFLYWEQLGVDWAIVLARPPLQRSYQKLMFSDLLADPLLYPASETVALMRQVMALGVPHYLMGVNMKTAKARWTESAHPLLRFFRYTLHPDINLHDPRVGTTAPPNLHSSAAPAVN